MAQATFVNETTNIKSSVDQLKSFCRGELSAVETYNKAMEAAWDTTVLTVLQRNLTSHQTRVKLLRSRILELGGEPPTSSGAWGTFAKVVEGAAAAFGEKPALSVLEEGEDRGLKEYRGDLASLDVDSQILVRDVILPHQQETHRAMSRVKHMFS